MGGIRDLKISTKLLLIMLMAGVGFGVFGAITYTTMRKVKVGGPLYEKISLNKDLVADLVPPAMYLSEARMNILEFLIVNDNQILQDRLKSYEEAKRDYGEAIDTYNKTVIPGKTLELINGTARQEAEAWFLVVNQELIPAKMRGDDKKALDIFMNKTRPHFLAHQKAAFEMLETINADEAAAESEATSAIRSGSSELVMVGVGIFCLVVIFGLFTSRLITGSLSKTVAVLEAVGTGDLRDRVAVDSKDESGMMGQALNETLDKISQAFQAIGGASVRLASASEEFSATSAQMGAIAEETSSQAGVVSAAGEEVNRTCKRWLPAARR